MSSEVGWSPSRASKHFRFSSPSRMQCMIYEDDDDDFERDMFGKDETHGDAVMKNARDMTRRGM